MPSKCCAVGCSKRDDRDDDVRFFRFPALLKKPDELVELSERRRNAWLEAINRTDIPEVALKYTRICSQHFVTGFPSRLKDTHHPDWVPTIKMGPKSFKRRRRSEKRSSPSPDNQFYIEPPKKTRGCTPRLSEVERLRLEIKSKDELIKNYKNEKVQREQDQIQVVSSYEKRLKEKDVKIKKGMRERANKDTISIEQEEETEGRGPTMRVGRKLRKTIVEEKKTKPCFVRLEKVHEKKQEAPAQAEQRTPANRKLTGPLKKRPLNTPSQVFKKKALESPFTVASTRTRRAPKPNPKYANADIITPKAKAKRGKELLTSFDAESDSAEDFYNALDESSNESDTNDGNVGEAFELEESSDFSELEELHLKPKRALRSVAPVAAVSANTPPVAKRGRPKKNTTTASPAVKAVELPPKKAVPTPVISRSIATPSQQLQLARKRKLEAAEVEPPESIIARNKRLNIALYDANVAKPLTSPKTVSPKVTNTTASSRTSSPTASSVLAQRRAERAAQLVKSVTKETREEKSKSPLQRQKSPAFAAKPKSPDILDPASTQDDFETMPTFTIVNIHDIINKKGDSLVQKNTEEEKGTTSPNTTNRVNRRKTGHTTILSEKLDPGKLRNPLPRTPFPPRKPISTILNSNNVTPRAEPKLPARVSLPPPERKPLPTVVAEKPAPRILNSVVAKRTYPVQPILGKLDNDIETDTADDPIEKTQMVKENVGANKVIPLKPALPRKLPPEKVFVQRQGNKLIKKITCFETWYVINIPETQEPIVKNCLDIPLITLSNAAKTIKLPSPSWSTKVTLYKLSAQMIGKTSLTPYTGDLSDQSIAEEDREKYQPSCVMFRRMTQHKSRTRMPYDRAVIFKMKTFFTNIDGKNVRLIGAPSTISTFEDIEVLLELIDELDLLHEFVEPANTI